MEPITLMVGIILLSTNSIDLVFDDGLLVDGFINESIILDTWQTTNNPNRYFGVTEGGDNFYMLVSDTKIMIKVWTDEGKIRIVELII